MPERRQKKEASSLRVPRPKKLGLSVTPFLRLPHEELIRTETSSNPSDERDADAARLEDSASHANLEESNSASLARTGTLARQITSLANPTSQANVAGLPERHTSASLMDSLPDTGGFTKLHHQIVDHLYYQLSPKEQIVHIHLYRLSWGRGSPNC